jgi:hypothetical protein
MASEPYSWPFDGNFSPDNTVFLVIDMQVSPYAYPKSSCCLRETRSSCENTHAALFITGAFPSACFPFIRSIFVAAADT